MIIFKIMCYIVALIHLWAIIKCVKLEIYEFKHSDRNMGFLVADIFIILLLCSMITAFVSAEIKNLFFPCLFDIAIGLFSLKNKGNKLASILFIVMGGSVLMASFLVA